MIALLNATANRIPLPDNSVHCIVTSPPYWGLRDYGLPGRVWKEVVDGALSAALDLMTQLSPLKRTPCVIS